MFWKNGFKSPPFLLHDIKRSNVVGSDICGLLTFAAKLWQHQPSMGCLLPLLPALET